MPDLMLELVYADGEVRQGATAHWPDGFPKKQIARLWIRSLRGASQWEIGGHSTFAVVPGDPVEVFTVDARDGQLVGDRWRFHASRDPEIDVIDLPRDSPLLPPLSAFIPMIEVKRTSAVDCAWLGNWDWVLRRWRARRR